jgi:hypothetical protein
MVAFLFDIRAGLLHVTPSGLDRRISVDTPDQPAQVVLRDVDDATLDDSGRRNWAAACLRSPSSEFGTAYFAAADAPAAACSMTAAIASGCDT